MLKAESVLHHLNPMEENIGDKTPTFPLSLGLDIFSDEGRKKTLFGGITDWVDDYKTRRSGYGPPYYAEYGGDLPRDCNRMGADLLCVTVSICNKFTVV